MYGKTLIPCAVILVALVAAGAQAADTTTEPNRAEKVLVTDGSVVHNVGDLWNHVTNWGLIGSRPGAGTTYSDAPSGYWHGWHHIWGASLWVGGVVAGEHLVTTGHGSFELMPSDAPGDSIFPAFAGVTGGTRYPWSGADDDGDGAEDEDPLNGLDDDGDGLVDEDFAAIGDQHFRCVMADTGAAVTGFYPDHTPMGLEVVQQSFQWADLLMTDAIGYDFTVRNVGDQIVENVHCGLHSDFDINFADDDQAGSWRGDVEASDGRVVPVTLAWMHDGAGVPVGGWMGWVMCGLVTDAAAGGPADPLAVSSFQHMKGNAAFGQGGDPTNDAERYELLSADASYWDPDTFQEADYRVLLSSEAVPALAPGESLTFRMALVAGVDLDALVQAAAEAVTTAMGQDFDRDGDPGNGDEFHVPWLRPGEIPVPNFTGDLRAATEDGGVALEFDLGWNEDFEVAVVRRPGPGVPARRWDNLGALAAGRLRDDDPVAWPRTYDLVMATASGNELVLDTVVMPGPPDVGLLLTAAPNPFNPRVTIHFTLPRSSVARLDILDLQGRLVRTLFHEARTGGPGQEVWNGRDLRGQDVASGVYLVRLRTDEEITSQRVTLLR